MSLRFAIDVDGTLADIHTPFLNELNKRYGTHFKLEDITEWGWGKIREEIPNIVEVFRMLSDEIWEKFLWRIKPIEKDVNETIRELRKKGKVYIVTSRNTIEAVKTWLFYYEIEYDGFFYTKPSSLKKLIHVDYLIDDNPELARELKDFTLFLYDRPWNRKIKENEQVIRINSLKEVCRYLK